MKYILLFSLLILFSCKREHDKTFEKIDLFAPEEDEVITLSDIASDVEYIPLQTTENSYIGRIASMKAVGKFFYIHELNQILCFDKSGNFLFRLNKSGRGPGEYEFLMGFNVNEKNTYLAIKSYKCILIYNQSDTGFIFINKFTLPSTPDKIMFIGEQDNLLLFYSNAEGRNPNSMEIINLKGETIFRRPNYLKFKLKGTVSTSLGDNITYSLNDCIYFKELMNDTVFNITEDLKIHPYLIFDTEDKRLTPEVRSDGKFYVSHKAEYFHIEEIYASERYIYYTYIYKKYGHTVYDILTKLKYQVEDKKFLVDDLGGGINFEPKFCDNGVFYSWVESLSLKDYVSGEIFKNSIVKFPEKKKELENMANSLKETDNPVLMIVRLKK